LRSFGREEVLKTSSDGGSWWPTEYVVTNDVEPIEAPEWLIELIIRNQGLSSPEDYSNVINSSVIEFAPPGVLELIERDAGMGLSNDPRDCTTPDEILAALAVINPDIERANWIAIGCVLFKAFGPKEGFRSWDSWSAKGEKYPKASEMTAQWRSICKGEGYGWGLGTLFHLANKANPNWRKDAEPPIEPVSSREPSPPEAGATQRPQENGHPMANPPPPKTRTAEPDNEEPDEGRPPAFSDEALALSFAGSTRVTSATLRRGGNGYRLPERTGALTTLCLVFTSYVAPVGAPRLAAIRGATRRRSPARRQWRRSNASRKLTDTLPRPSTSGTPTHGY
jgi:hypothetical protein